MTMLATAFESSSTASRPATYVLYWRFRPMHPWTVEEFSQRSRAYNRFFNLLERGIEARFETSSETAGHRAVRTGGSRGHERETLPLVERYTAN
jgi:hypothetical protein